MKKVFISIFTLIFIISMVNYVFAATSGSVEVRSSSTTIKAGDEITIFVSAADSNNLNAVGYTNITITNSQGTDSTSLFEIKSVEKASENVSGNISDNGKTYFLMNAGEFKSSDIFKFNVKALDTVPEGTYNVNINGLVVDNKTNALGIDEQKTTNVGTKTVQIKAIKDTTIIDGGDTTPQQDNGQEQIPSTTPQTDNGQEQTPSTTPQTDNGNGGNSGRIVSTSGDNDSGAKTLPQTGVNYTWIIAIAVLSVSAIVSFVSYKKFKNI